MTPAEMPLNPSILHPPSSILYPPSSLILGGSRASWNWKEREGDEATMNGIEAWAFALRGNYKPGIELEAKDFEEYDLIVVNLNFGFLPHYQRLLSMTRTHRARIIGL